MQLVKNNKTMLLIVFVAFLSACAGSGNQVGGIIPMDKEWHLSSMNGNDLIEGSKIILKFHLDNEIGGNAGCNYFGGNYVSADGSMFFSEVTSARMACLEPEGLMDQEADYFAAMTNTAAYHAESNRLELFYEDGNVILENGVLLTADEEKIKRNGQKSADDLAERAGTAGNKRREWTSLAF